MGFSAYELTLRLLGFLQCARAARALGWGCPHRGHMVWMARRPDLPRAAIPPRSPSRAALVFLRFIVVDYTQIAPFVSSGKFCDLPQRRSQSSYANRVTIQRRPSRIAGMMRCSSIE